jgi:hypothetical protein
METEESASLSITVKADFREIGGHKDKSFRLAAHVVA